MTMLGRLFGTDKAISDITDKDNGLLTQVGGWVGNFNYTAEEQAENNHKTREWGLKQLEALAPFKVVQRILAFATCLVWILVIINVLVSMWIEAIHPEILIRETMLEFAFSDFVFWPVTVCFALYFGGGLVESIKRRISSID